MKNVTKVTIENVTKVTILAMLLATQAGCMMRDEPSSSSSAAAERADLVEPESEERLDSPRNVFMRQQAMLSAELESSMRTRLADKQAAEEAEKEAAARLLATQTRDFKIIVYTCLGKVMEDVRNELNGNIPESDHELVRNLLAQTTMTATKLAEHMISNAVKYSRSQCKQSDYRQSLYLHKNGGAMSGINWTALCVSMDDKENVAESAINCIISMLFACCRHDLWHVHRNSSNGNAGFSLECFGLLDGRRTKGRLFDRYTIHGIHALDLSEFRSQIIRGLVNPLLVAPQAEFEPTSVAVEFIPTNVPELRGFLERMRELDAQIPEPQR